jgi:SWI/SNF-related matrix-associated actin-dependent regulator 1 of chromatin subfamily A
MMTPFVLRRRKDQVLKDLPKKIERVEWCEMTAMQKSIYEDSLKRSRKTIEDLPRDEKALLEAASDQPEKKKGRPKNKALTSSGMNSSNILMQLRKASSHPMLFRRLFSDSKIKLMAEHCLSEPEFAESKYDLVVEDMEVSDCSGPRTSQSLQLHHSH